MHRKLIVISILSIFFLTWGISNSGLLHKETAAKSALSVVAGTPFRSDSAQPDLIPVTGKPHLGWEIFLLYGLIGLATLILILALLAAANQSTPIYTQRKPSQDETQNG
jgi:hypothetical protein